MKKLVLLSFLISLSTACTKKQAAMSEVEPIEKQKCVPATIGQAAERILGTWKLTKVESGWVNDSTPDLQKLIFKADGTCTVITKDSTYAAVNYSMKRLDQVVKTPVSVSGAALVLVAGDTIRAGREYYLVNKSVLTLCQDEMILDYGLGIYADAGVLTYRREVK